MVALVLVLVLQMVLDDGDGVARNIWLNYEGRRPEFMTRHNQKTPMASQSASD